MIGNLGSITGIAIILLLIGVFFLLTSMWVVYSFTKILRFNGYGVERWYLVQGLIIFFILGYVLQGMVVMGVIVLPIDPAFIVNLVYFFGAIFVLSVLLSTENMVNSILGRLISDTDAYRIFLERTGSEFHAFPHLTDRFEIFCEDCNRKIEYSIPDVIRQHYSIYDKGISLQTTFGVRNFLLRPTHRCTRGRREITVVHDKDLAFRSIDRSRLILGDDIL